MAEHEVRTVAVKEISAVAETPQGRKVLAEILADLHPRLSEEKTDLAAIFPPETASEFLARLTDFQSLLSEADTGANGYAPASRGMEPVALDGPQGNGVVGIA